MMMKRENSDSTVQLNDSMLSSTADGPENASVQVRNKVFSNAMRSMIMSHVMLARWSSGK